MKKDDYIEKAVNVHGDEYDYANLPLIFRIIDRVPIIEDLLKDNTRLINELNKNS